MGIQFQTTALPPRIRVGEALNSSPLSTAVRRSHLLPNCPAGRKQRLFVALALVNDPIVVFFDELTTGLDPQSRRPCGIW